MQEALKKHAWKYSLRLFVCDLGAWDPDDNKMMIGGAEDDLKMIPRMI